MRTLASSSALVVALALGAMGAVMPRVAVATPGKDGCTGFLQHEPGAFETHVTTPGVWCLDSDLTSTVTGSAAILISVEADDVTIDCRGHRLEYLASYDFSVGIDAFMGADRLVIRNCRFLGWGTAISLGSSMDYVIEDNLVEGSILSFYGAAVVARGRGTIQRNRIIDSLSLAIRADDDVLVADNLIDGVVDDGNDGDGQGIKVVGIESYDTANVEIRGNTIRGLAAVPPGSRSATAVSVGFSANDRPVQIRDNVLVNDGSALSLAFECVEFGPGLPRYADNVISGFAQVQTGCVDAGDNDVSP